VVVKKETSQANTDHHLDLVGLDWLGVKYEADLEFSNKTFFESFLFKANTKPTILNMEAKNSVKI